MKPFMESAEQTLIRLGVDRESGLTPEQVQDSVQAHGSNRFSREKPPSMLRRIADAAKEPMILLLIFAAVVTLGVNIVRFTSSGHADFVECVGIFVAIALSVLITVIMEGKSAKAFEALSEMQQQIHVRVLRDGRMQVIAQKDVVVGDLVFLQTGDGIPADGRLIQSVQLHADESPLTGESMAIQKDASIVYDREDVVLAERANMLYAGCFITEGNGLMVVTAVGERSEFGKIARELSKVDDGSTPLQEKMARLGKIITILGGIAAALAFILQAVELIVQGTFTFELVSEAFITSIVLIVAAVPEGLPTIVAVSLAINIIKMSKQNALVKKMIACETVGCINVICSDKTGTLTENRMKVQAVYERNRIIQPLELKDKRILENFCINSTADVDFAQAGEKFIGNPTECALLAAARSAGIDYKSIRKEAKLLYVYPFTTETKNMTSVVQGETKDLVYSKGSPEKIFSLCDIPVEVQREIERQMAIYQAQACRVLAFAHKHLPHGMEYEAEQPLIERNMVFDGFVAIADPLRADVYQAVDRCRSAGIDLKILTGDNLLTATAIARELGVLDKAHHTVEASSLEKLSDEQLKEILPSIRVIARSTPTVKMRVVSALREMGNVVAVTGDGINDAPAIKQADVGIAMGIAGTEVAKQASDVVLLDDSFSTIVRAVQWGRGIYENFQRFIQFQLTVNLSSVIVVLASILMGMHSPFNALELLWINIIMDGPPALTLGLEPIREDLLKRKPTPRNQSIVTRSMLWRIALNGVYISVVFLLQSCTNFLGVTPEQQSTVLFTLFVLFQLFNAFNSRELGRRSIFSNFLKNKLMLGVFAITFLLQVVITQWGGAIFHTVALPLDLWIRLVAVAISVLLVAEIAKWIGRVRERRRAL